MSDEQLKILGAFAEVGEDYCIGYRTLEPRTGMTREQLKPLVAELRKLGYAYYAKGLMNEDGEVAGSGFGITREGLDFYYNAQEDAE